MRKIYSIIFVAIAGAACGGSEDAGVAAYFDLAGGPRTNATYFDLPFPSDLRLTTAGKPDLVGYPVRSTPLFDDILESAADRPGFPVMPAAYFHFDGPVRDDTADAELWTGLEDPAFLVDIDASSLNRGAVIPILSRAMLADDALPDNVLALAPRPGFVLEPNRQYAFVIRKSFGDLDGNPLSASTDFVALSKGVSPSGPLGTQAVNLYEPLWDTLEQLAVEVDDLAVATVFTTGDVVQDMFDISEQARLQWGLRISGLSLAGQSDAFCELSGNILMPQFQRGTAPFDTEGSFEFDDQGRLIAQGQVEIPVVITLPRREMPSAGYPLAMYFHGSGGDSRELITTRVNDAIAQHGIAMAGSALPVNPERVPGASEQEYLNFNNLSAFRDTFRQGVIEQRLLLDALLHTEIDPLLVADCSGPALAAGQTHFVFDPANLTAQGQSMGGMYTNLIGAVEPRLRALVPTGAGGYWNFFILETSLVPGASGILAAVIGTSEAELEFLHPAMHLLGLAWEGAEPMVYMPRLARRPLPGQSPKHIYQPVAPDDVYFPPSVFEAVALAYGHGQAGTQVWAGMQEVLGLAGLDGLVDYPVHQNAMSADGSAYTGVTIQYPGGHAIYRQREDVRHQFGCFHATAFASGVPTVVSPEAVGQPCTPP